MANEFATEVVIETSLRRGLFLDRDGTIIEEKHYLCDPDQVELLPTVAETIFRANRLGIVVVVVTNQSGVGRGLFPEDCVGTVHSKIDAILTPFQAKIDRYEYCPNHPKEGVGKYRIDCGRRKPQPGMLTDAASMFGVDLSRSLMVGDRLSDIEAGANAGCCSSLIRTGYGLNVDFNDCVRQPGFIGSFDSLKQAFDHWLKETL